MNVTKRTVADVKAAIRGCQSSLISLPNLSNVNKDLVSRIQKIESDLDSKYDLKDFRAAKGSRVTNKTFGEENSMPLYIVALLRGIPTMAIDDKKASKGFRLGLKVKKTK